MSGADRLEYDKRVNRVIDHIRGRLAEELTLADLARAFHAHFGMSATAWRAGGARAVAGPAAAQGAQTRP